MLKRLVAFLLFASGVAWSSVQAVEQGAPTMTQVQLYEPALVVAWLKENGGKADKALAAEFFKAGEKQRKQRRWGPAGKSFGASALHYPTPHALNEYAEIKLIFLGAERSRDGNLLAHVVSDLRSSELLYRSVIAADSVLHAMSASEQQLARTNADCLTKYLRDRTVVPACRPLSLYGLTRR